MISPVDDLRAAIATFDEVAGAVRPDQLTLPTPCSEWDVAAILEHVGRGAAAFARAVDPDAVPEPAVGTGYEAGRDASLRVLGGTLDLDRTVAMPMGEVPLPTALGLRTVDHLVHAWDLARATGQEVLPDEGLVERALTFSRQALSRMPADGRPFAPPAQVDSDAAPLDRLAALLGREVS